jgi:anti-anti-sigma factor
VSFDISRTEDGTNVVAVAGELDIASSPALTARMVGLSGDVVVDLSGLTFIDSSGITALVNAARAVTGGGGLLVIASPSPHTRRVFEIVHLADVVPIEETLAAALELISQNGSGAE